MGAKLRGRRGEVGSEIVVSAPPLERGGPFRISEGEHLVISRAILPPMIVASAVLVIVGEVMTLAGTAWLRFGIKPNDHATTLPPCAMRASAIC